MSDQEEIRNKIALYGLYADDDNIDGYRSLFARDGKLVAGDIEVPASQFAAMMHANKEMKDAQVQPFGSKHLQVNVAIGITSKTTAIACTDLLYLSLRPETVWTIGGCGRYNDEWIKEDGAWKISRRVISWYKGITADSADEETNQRVQQFMREAAAGR